MGLRSADIARAVVGLLVASVAGCAGPPAIAPEQLASYPPHIQQAMRSRQLILNMPADAVALAFGATDCRVATQFHGNPAQAWGYKAAGRRVKQKWPRLASSPCVTADYWIYFEREKVVGWTN